jgi:hypothetical protein
MAGALAPIDAALTGAAARALDAARDIEQTVRFLSGSARHGRGIGAMHVPAPTIASRPRKRAHRTYGTGTHIAVL